MGSSEHRRTGHCGILVIATWAARFWTAQDRLFAKKKEERKGRKDCFNILATASLRTQSAPASECFSFLKIFNHFFPQNELL